MEKRLIGKYEKSNDGRYLIRLFQYNNVGFYIHPYESNRTDLIENNYYQFSLNPYNSENEFYAHSLEKIDFDEKNNQSDKIVQQVIDKFNQRSEAGIQKYGTTLWENDKDDYLKHLQEELMDAVLYIEKLRSAKSIIFSRYHQSTNDLWEK